MTMGPSEYVEKVEPVYQEVAPEPRESSMSIMAKRQSELGSQLSIAISHKQRTVKVYDK